VWLASTKRLLALCERRLGKGQCREGSRRGLPRLCFTPPVPGFLCARAGRRFLQPMSVGLVEGEGVHEAKLVLLGETGVFFSQAQAPPFQFSSLLARGRRGVVLPARWSADSVCFFCCCLGGVRQALERPQSRFSMPRGGFPGNVTRPLVRVSCPPQSQSTADG
jgi:hypothetical protein